MDLPWNPTVIKMTLLVLKELEGYDEDIFCRSCEELFLRKENEEEEVTNKDDHNGNGLWKETSHQDRITRTTSPSFKRKPHIPKYAKMNLPLGISSSKQHQAQPAQASSSHSTMMPPPPSRPSSSSSQYRQQQQNAIRSFRSTSKPPPLTITGVAPWAINGGSSIRRGAGGGPSLGPLLTHPPRLSAMPSLPSSTSSSLSSSSMTKQNLAVPVTTAAALSSSSSSSPHIPKLTTVDNTQSQEEETTHLKNISTKDDDKYGPGLQKVRSYIDRLKKKKGSSSSSSGDNEDEEDGDGISSWAKAAMAESPVLIPDLKFHDLVFGHVLGEGAFGQVKYARQIRKDRTRSTWPEYAVKIVSTSKIEELGYEASVNREIAILRTQLFHPGIARLISSFRFRDGAYLVLEYASKGDLHTLLKNNGSLNDESTQFVIGEVVSALWSIHEKGLLYGDLKPENILITESGHIKLTDFGGCRPITAQSKEEIRKCSKNILKTLRNGDWRDNVSGNHDINGRGIDEDMQEDQNDDRIEGTTAYLPPEVVLGQFPSLAADSWALGCVFFQCLSARPPILEDDDILTKKKIVNFDLSLEQNEDLFFGITGADSIFSNEAKALIKRLLSHKERDRPDMMVVSQDLYFKDVDVFAMHTKEAYPLNIGSAPAPDAKWTRRQFSSIWAPQPQAYLIEITDTGLSANSHDSQSETSYFLEGDEAHGPFLKHKKSPLLHKIVES